MIKTITWKNTEIRNYSASVEIPDDVLNEGGDALISYLADCQIEGTLTGCEVIEDFLDIEVG